MPDPEIVMPDHPLWDLFVQTICERRNINAPIPEQWSLPLLPHMECNGGNGWAQSAFHLVFREEITGEPTPDFSRTAPSFKACYEAWTEIYGTGCSGKQICSCRIARISSELRAPKPGIAQAQELGVTAKGEILWLYPIDIWILTKADDLSNCEVIESPSDRQCVIQRLLHRSTLFDQLCAGDKP